MKSTEWRQPIDLVAQCGNASADLAAAFTTGRESRPLVAACRTRPEFPGRRSRRDHRRACRLQLLREPHAPTSAARWVYAAALRVARFGTANEHGDWETHIHVFTYCNAVHQVLKRIDGNPEHVADFIDASRAVLHGALAIYLIRYLKRATSAVADPR